MGRAFAGVSACALAALGVVVPAAQTPARAVDVPAACDGIRVIDDGHADVFEGFIKDGKIDLHTKWDNRPQGEDVFSAPEKTLVYMGPNSKTPQSKGLLGYEAYVAPQVQVQGIPWIGWDFMPLAAGGFTSAELDVESVKGPGALTMFIDGGGFSGSMKPLAEGKNDNDFVLHGGDVLPDHMGSLSHKHFYWGFEKPGVYTITGHLNAHGSRDAQTPSHTWTFAVDTDLAAACQALKGGDSPSTGGTDATTNPTKPSDSDKDEGKKDDDGTKPGEPVNLGEAQPGASVMLNASDFDPAGGDLTFTFDDPAVTLATAKPDAKGAVSGVKATIPAEAKDGKHTITVSQGDKKVLLSLTVKKAKEDKQAASPTTSSESPSTAASTAGEGNSSPMTSGSATTAGSSGATTGGSATEKCVPTTVTTKVSAADAAKQGLTETGKNGALSLVPMMKDDRSAPAKWVRPESLTFGLGEAAKAEAPAELGSMFGISGTVYMVPSTQIAGVPWVGANTQNESIINSVNGAVTWKLESVDGPGKLAVFESGNFGKVVGNVWFSKVGDTHDLGLKTHVHPNWVFSAPGTYKVRVSETAKLTNGQTVSGATTLTFIAGGAGSANEGHFDLGAEISKGGAAASGKTVTKNADGSFTVTETVGRTASGKPCSLDGLAKTGVTPVTPALVVFGVGLVVAGLGSIALHGQLSKTRR